MKLDRLIVARLSFPMIHPLSTVQYIPIQLSGLQWPSWKRFSISALHYPLGKKVNTVVRNNASDKKSFCFVDFHVSPWISDFNSWIYCHYWSVANKAAFDLMGILPKRKIRIDLKFTAQLDKPRNSSINFYWCNKISSGLVLNIIAILCVDTYLNLTEQ